MAHGHSRRERALFTAIRDKNGVAKRIHRSSGAIRRWTDRLRKKRSKRWQAQYSRSIQRHSVLLEKSIAEVQRRNRDLEGRIQEELEVSVSEVKQYQEKYRQEVAELREAQAALEEAREALVQAEAQDSRESANVMADLRRRQARAARTARREAADVRGVERELASEVSDRVVLESELRRIMAETEALA